MAFLKLMQNIYKNGLIFILILVFIFVIPCYARSMKNGEVIITIRDGQPCFSYPQDEQIKKRPYSFGYLSVSKRGHTGGDGWEIQTMHRERKKLIEPNNAKSGIKYGGPHPGTEDKYDHAQPLKMNAPYEVSMRVDGVSDEWVYTRYYNSEFCISSDKGNTVIVGTYTENVDGFIKWKCLKPGEKRGFWQWLFLANEA